MRTAADCRADGLPNQPAKPSSKAEPNSSRHQASFGLVEMEAGPRSGDVQAIPSVCRRSDSLHGTLRPADLTEH
jgi:hypothetical protein